MEATVKLVVLAALLVVGCSPREKRYESAVQVIRKEVLDKDDAGAATQIDFEVEWDACPGDQFQVIRGDQAFAKCTESFAVGDYAPVVVRHFWDERGYYRWDIERFGDCMRAVEPNSYGSYEKSRECKDVVNQGKTVGFDCSRKPYREVLARCPWMARD